MLMVDICYYFLNFVFFQYEKINMINILTPDEIRQADSYAINGLSIPSIVLMENAARSSAIYIKEIFAEKNILTPKILILCGNGNNGGDGYAIARHLNNAFDVTVYWIGSIDKMSPETKSNFESVMKIGIKNQFISKIEDINSLNFEFDCIIDSLIGVGGSENIKGIAEGLLLKVKDINKLKFAIDTPTGLNTLTGKAHPACFKADYTITMFAWKLGLILNDGYDFSGKILKADLGAPESIVENLSQNYIFTKEDIQNIFPARKRKSSKFDYGKLLIIAGSKKYPGAAALTSNAAIKMGTGLVSLFSTAFHPAIYPEIINIYGSETKDGSLSKKNMDKLIDLADNSDSIIVGPGLTDNYETIQMVQELIDEINVKIPIIIDADGLKSISTNKKLRKNIILTPHTGEFSRISGVERKEIELDTYNNGKFLANELDCIIHLKSVPSITTDGEKSYLTITGNPGMATGGSGDVLSGIIGSLLAQKIDPFRAASLGAYIHSLAGDKYIEANPVYTLLASDIINNLAKVLKD